MAQKKLNKRKKSLVRSACFAYVLSMENILAQLAIGSTIARVRFFKEGKDSTGQGEVRILENAIVQGVKANKEGNMVCTVKAEGSYKSFSIRCVTSLVMA